MSRLLPAIIDTAKSSAGAKVGKKAPHALSGLMPRAIEAAAGGVVGGASGAAVHSARKNNTETAPNQSRSSLLRSTLIGAGLGAVGAVAGNQALLVGARKKDQAAMEAWRLNKDKYYGRAKKGIFGEDTQRAASRQASSEEYYKDMYGVLRFQGGKKSKEELLNVLRNDSKGSAYKTRAILDELTADEAEKHYNKLFLKNPSTPKPQYRRAVAFGGFDSLLKAGKRLKTQAVDLPLEYNRVIERVKQADAARNIVGRAFRSPIDSKPPHMRYAFGLDSVFNEAPSQAAKGQLDELLAEIEGKAVEDYLSGSYGRFFNDGGRAKRWGGAMGAGAHEDIDGLFRRAKDLSGFDVEVFQTKDEFSKATKQLLRQLHPDQPGGNAERFKAVSETFGDLKNSEWFQKLASIDLIKDAIYKTASLSRLVPRAIEATTGALVGGAIGARASLSGKSDGSQTGGQRNPNLIRNTLIGAGIGAAGAVAGRQMLSGRAQRAKNLATGAAEARDRLLSKNDHQMRVDALQKSKGDAFEAISKRHEDLRNKINDLETRFWPTASTYGARGQTVPTEAATSALSRAQTDDLFKEMEDDLASLSHGLLGKKALLNSLKGAIYKTASLSRPAPQP